MHFTKHQKVNTIKILHYYINDGKYCCLYYYEKFRCAELLGICLSFWIIECYESQLLGKS